MTMNPRTCRYLQILLLAATVMTAATASGQPAFPANTIGVFADPGAGSNSLDADLYSIFPLYLVLVYPSETSGVHGWEVNLRVEGMINLSTTYAGNGNTILGDDDHMVALAEPLPYGETVVLAELEYLLMEPEAFVYLDAVSVPSVEPAAPCYAPGDLDHARGLVPLNVSSGDPAEPVFAVNAFIVGVAEAPPAAPALHQNRPNPFNPATVIDFDLPRAGRPLLRIYDLAGRLVRDLSPPAELPAGHHSQSWDGRDDAGRSLPSGVYVGRVTCGDWHDEVRMTLVK
jgi:hypothetical protein